MRISIIINDDTIRQDVAEAIENAIDDGFILFPNDAANDEFFDDCVELIIGKYEFYDYYSPNYPEIVLDMAEQYGYAQ